jgi:hypothetical protein
MRYRLARVAPYSTALLLVVALTASCVPQADLPADCSASAVQRQATLAGEGLKPPSIDVCRGQQVTLVINVQRDGVLHLHGYDVELPETELHAGTTAHLGFTAVRSGQFPIELHSADGTEVEVGIFTVHEP